MAWTQTEIDALKAAMAEGVLSVKYPNGGEVVYRDQAQMERQLSLMQGEVDALAGTTRIRQIRVSGRSGY